MRASGLAPPRKGTKRTHRLSSSFTSSWTSSPRDLITLAIAAYAAVLSTVVAVRSILRERPRVRLRLGPGLTSTAEGRIQSLWVLRVVNPGPRPITIERVGLKRKDKPDDYWAPVVSGPTFPLTLAEQEHAVVTFEAERPINMVRSAWARSLLGDTFVVRWHRWSPRTLFDRMRGKYTTDDW